MGGVYILWFPVCLRKTKWDVSLCGLCTELCPYFWSWNLLWYVAHVWIICTIQIGFHPLQLHICKFRFSQRNPTIGWNNVINALKLKRMRLQYVNFTKAKDSPCCRQRFDRFSRFPAQVHPSMQNTCPSLIRCFPPFPFQRYATTFS